MADESVVDATLVDDSCDKTIEDRGVTQGQEEPFLQFTYTFDTGSESRLEGIEDDLNSALTDLENIKKKLRVIQDVFSAGVAVENKMKETLKE